LRSLFPRAVELEVFSGECDDSVVCTQCLSIKNISIARRDDLKKWAKETLADEACIAVFNRKNPKSFNFFEDNEEIHVLKQKCLNDWRDVVEQLLRMGSFPGGKDELLPSCHLLCRHKKMRLPIQLKDALLGKREYSAVFDDDSDSNIRYECLLKSEFKSIQKRISSLNKLTSALANEGLTSENEFRFKGLNSHAKIVRNISIVDSTKRSIYNTYTFEPELCQICSDESDSERKILLNFVALQSYEEIPPSFSHSAVSRTRSRLPNKRCELNMVANDSLAKLRLLLFEQAGFSPLGQKLTLAQHSRELPYSSNDQPLENLGIVNGAIIYVQNLSLIDGSGIKSLSSISRRDKKEMENEMVESLLDIHMAYERKNGCSNSDTIKLQSGHSGERGFSGTLLESSKVGNSEGWEVLNDDLHGRDQSFLEEMKRNNKVTVLSEGADCRSNCNYDESFAERFYQSNIEARLDSSIIEVSSCSRQASISQDIISISSHESNESIISL
jgi:hypothetical protein